jgi:acetyl-CoA carboxylase biotin carboxyl carrier protein
MDIEAIEEVIRLFNKSGLSKLNVKDGSLEILMEGAALNGSPLSLSGMKELSGISLESTIDAPMVGAFYRAPSPTEKPFINAGDKVKKGDVLCVIEAMKVMNEVRAKRDGMITEIKVKDGDAVEFGKPLFVVE